MTDDSPMDDTEFSSVGESDEHPPDTPPTVTCSQCNQTWTLSYELDDLRAGNRAVEQFAMDHHRHTGHYPDDVMPFIVDCNQCPVTEQYLAHRPAERFAETHARHTGHTIELAGSEEAETITPGTVR